MLLALELESLRIGDRRAGLHTQQRIVRFVVVAMHVVRVVGGEQRSADATSDLDQLRVRVALGLHAVVLQLDEQVVLAEDLLQPAGLLQRALLVALDQRLQNLATETAGRGHQAAVVLLEQLPIHARLVVVALEEREAGELDQVAIALVAFSEQRQVVVELLAAFGVATGIVDTPTPCGPFVPTVVGHVRLGADDRLHALAATLLVEVEDAVHVAVVGDAEPRLSVLHCLGDEIVEHALAPSSIENSV